MELYPGPLYLELAFHGNAAEKLVNRGLIAIAQRMELPLVATNTVRFATPDDALAHKVLEAVGRGATADGMLGHTGRDGYDLPTLTVESVRAQAYLTTPKQMWRALGHMPAALHATVEIAERCEFRLPLANRKLADQGQSHSGRGCCSAWSRRASWASSNSRNGWMRSCPLACPPPVAARLQSKCWSASAWVHGRRCARYGGTPRQHRGASGAVALEPRRNRERPVASLSAPVSSILARSFTSPCQAGNQVRHIQQPPLDGLKRYLRDRNLLLVLDNFEQVLGAATEVAELLTALASGDVHGAARAPAQVSLFA